MAYVDRAAASRASTIARQAAKPCHCETARARFSGFAKKPERKQRPGAAGPLCEALISVTARGAKRHTWRQTSDAAPPRTSSCLNAHSFCDLGASSISFMWKKTSGVEEVSPWPPKSSTRWWSRLSAAWSVAKVLAAPTTQCATRGGGRLGQSAFPAVESGEGALWQSHMHTKVHSTPV